MFLTYPVSPASTTPSLEASRAPAFVTPAVF